MKSEIQQVEYFGKLIILGVLLPSGTFCVFIQMTIMVFYVKRDDVVVSFEFERCFLDVLHWTFPLYLPPPPCRGTELIGNLPQVTVSYRKLPCAVNLRQLTASYRKLP